MGLWQTVDTESEAAIAKGRGQRHAKQALAAFRDARAVRTPTTQPPPLYSSIITVCDSVELYRTAHNSCFDAAGAGVVCAGWVSEP